MKPRIALIGPGRVGAAVGNRLHQAGYQLSAVISRSQQQAEDAVSFIGCDPMVATTELKRARQGEIILLAVPDDQINVIAKQLQKTIDPTSEITLVHFSGLHPASIMSVEGSNCTAVSIHPLLSFADREMAAAQLTGCPCAIEGHESALATAEKLVSAMNGRAFRLPSEVKALYHTAACVASNYLVTITASARDLLLSCGFDNQQAMELLIPIHKATSDNLTRLGPETALTGPIVRGDRGTVNDHLNALKEQKPELLELYCRLGERTVDLAEASGRLPKERALELHQLLADTCQAGKSQ